MAFTEFANEFFPVVGEGVISSFPLLTGFKPGFDACEMDQSHCASAFARGDERVFIGVC